MKTLGLVVVGILLAALVVAGRVTGAPADVPVKPDLAVSIPVIERGEIYAADNKAHIHVILKNISDHDIKIPDEWNSWGFFCVTLEWREGDGKISTMSKSHGDWMKNFLTITILKPGEELVREVYLDEKDWNNVPLPAKGESKKLKFRAIFTSEEKPERNEDIWRGKVQSEEREFTVRR